MDPDSLFSLFMIILMVALGVFFSATETAFSALNRIRIKTMADEGSKRAALVLHLHDDFDKLLSTILILNNLVTLIAAAISTMLFVRHFGDIGATLSTVILTVVIILIGDITPKSLAKESPEKYALVSAPLLYACMVLLTPINYLFTKWKIMLRFIFRTSPDEDRMTEEELYSVVEVAQNDGVIDEEGRQLLDNAIEFSELKAVDILTPRIDVEAVSVDSSESEIATTFINTGYSRLPVYKDNIDDIVGVVHMKDFFNFAINKQGTLKELFIPPLFVAPSAKISDLFKQLQTNKSHLAVVSDEYGGTAGIVTMEDILEELVGDIWDESDEVIVEFTSIGDNKHKILCSAYVKDLFAYFDLPDDTDAESTTVSGWIMDALGRLPEEGDTFTYKNLTVTVHKTEHRRVQECIIEVENQAELNELTKDNEL